MSIKKKALTRRDFLRIMGVTAAGATLAACTPGGAPSSGTSPTSAPADAQSSSVSAEPITLRFTSWDSASGEDVYNNVVGQFKAKFPNIEVKVEFNPDGYDDKILTGIAGGNAPDVFMWWNFPSLAAKGGLENLIPFVEGSSGVDLSTYYKPVIETSMVGDALYGMPNAFTPRALFYNKKLFDEAGLPHPTNDWTWDDLLEIAKKLTKGTGPEAQYGFYTYNGVYPLQCYVWSNGGDFISPDGKKASGYCDSPETIQAIDWYTKLQTEHKVAPTAEAETTVGGASQMFQNNKLALFDNGRWPQTDFKKVEGLEFGTVLPPASPNTKKLITVLHTSGFCVNPATPHKAEAFELAKFLGGVPGNKAIAEAGWAIPALPSVVEELGMEKDPIEKTWLDAVPFATVQPCFMRTTKWSEADVEFGTAIQSIFLGKATAEEAMKQVAPIVDAILSAA